MNVANRSFAGGELAPQLYARTDLAKYAVGLRQCRNFMVMRQGGAAKRPGTLFVNAVKDSTKHVRLIPFVFSISDALVLEFGEHYIRFYQDGGVVVDPASPPNPYEITTPYTETDLPDLKYVQRADIITIVHKNYPPQELKRFGDTNWTLSAIVFGPSLAAPTGPAATGGAASLIPRVSSYRITAVAADGEESYASDPAPDFHWATSTAPVTVSWVASVSAVSYRVYKLLPDALVDNAVTGGVYCFLGETTNLSFSDDGTLVADVTRQPPIANTLFQAINTYPSVVAYYQQRLVLANSNNNPDTVWCSRTGSFHNFTTSTFIQDDDAITFRLTSDEIDSVQHVLNVGRMVVLTTGAEWIVEGDGNGVLTPTSVNARIGATDGVAALRPVKVANQLLFLQALGSQIRQIQANVQFGYYSLTSADLTIYSSHLVDGFQITEWTWQQIYPHVLWAVRSDGTLLGLTYIPEQEVLAWHRHDTKGFVESVCAVPEGSEQFVYWVARRLIQGVYVRYIERQTSSIQFPVLAVQPGTGVVTPPPVPSSIAPPTSPSTTDVTTTGATANWIAGNLSAGSTVQIRQQGQSDASWASHAVAAGQQSFVFTGLSSGVAYEWRVEHVIGTTTSAWLGPTTATQFTTVAATPTLTDPAAAPTITGFGDPSSGVTPVVIQWLASPQGADAEIQIAGPTSIPPTDGEFTEVGTGPFTSAVTGALWQITVSGDYWVRIQYQFTGFNNSAFVTSTSIPITVLP